MIYVVKYPGWRQPTRYLQQQAQQQFCKMKGLDSRKCAQKQAGRALISDFCPHPVFVCSTRVLAREVRKAALTVARTHSQ